MKSSTLYRSNLSKEKMILLEELRAKSGQVMVEDNNEPKAYKRLGKQKELDLLWQNFKISAKEDKSPGVYLLTGFIAGALSMFLMTALLSFASNAINNNSTESPKLVKRVKPAKEAKISIIPADQVVEEAKTISPETYTVKSGDTLEGIVIRFYGSYDASKIEKIMEANNLLNPNQLSIGQSLIIPLE